MQSPPSLPDPSISLPPAFLLSVYLSLFSSFPEGQNAGSHPLWDSDVQKYTGPMLSCPSMPVTRVYSSPGYFNCISPFLQPVLSSPDLNTEVRYIHRCTHTGYFYFFPLKSTKYLHFLLKENQNSKLNCS